MNGKPRSERRRGIGSIRRYLTRAILVILFASSAASLVVSYVIIDDEMDEIFDAQLSMLGRIVTGMTTAETSAQEYQRIAEQLTDQENIARFYSLTMSHGRLTDDDAADPNQASPDEPVLALGFWNDDGTPRLLSGSWSADPPFPAPQRPGYAWVEYQDHSWRVYTRYDEASRIWVSIGLRERFQTLLSRKIAFGNTLPDAISVMLAAILIYFVIRHGMSPLGNLSRQLSRRHDQDLSPIEGEVPRELAGLHTALNAFIERLREALERERRFTADAAHELRTPLAALKIHLDNARASDGVQSEDSFDKARLGIERLQRVVDQLLTLARLDRHRPNAPARVDLYPIAAQLASELWPLAEARGQRLAMSGLTRLDIYADPTEVGVLLRNLLDNALRYTPNGGSVEIRLERIEGVPSLCVVDDGSGIEPELLDKVTERFRRGSAPRASGSGLGLSIVATLIKQQRAQLHLRNRDEGGLEARITWPATPSDPAIAQDHSPHR